jgi:hypothetical protein
MELKDRVKNYVKETKYPESIYESEDGRLDRIFRVIFDEVAKRREEKNRQLQTSEYILKKHE